MGVSRNKIAPHLYRRYGLPEQTPWRLRAFAGVAAVGALWVFWTVGSSMAAGGDTTVISWKVSSPTSVSIRWSVHRNDNQPLTCVLRVQDQERYDVGFGVGRVRNTASSPILTVTMITRGEIFGVADPVCVTQGSQNLLGSHFRPGFLPPTQTNGLASPGQPLLGWLN